MELRSFLDSVDNLFVAMFCSPTSENKLTAAAKRKRVKTQQKIFDKLQTLAAAKVSELNEFLEFQVGTHFKEFKDKIGGIKLVRLLKQTNPRSGTKQRNFLIT